MHHFVKTIVLAVALVFGFATPSAFASWYGTESTYSVKYDFSGRAWGKEVASVTVHTGVLIELRDASGVNRPELFWQDIQDVVMLRSGDRFAADATVIGVAGGGTGHDYTADLGPVAQYWVVFADGSRLISEVVSVPLRTSVVGIHGTVGTLVGQRRMGSR